MCRESDSDLPWCAEDLWKRHTMMLDLNLLLFSESSSKPEKLSPEGSSGVHTDYSESSNSSILNAEDASAIADENSPTRPALTFDILKAPARRDEDVVELDGENTGVSSNFCFVTRQLFPSPPPPADEGSTAAEHFSSSREHLLDFSFCQADSSAITEVKTLHPPQPQVKKSRRGPRSRSSQYRGVTFYRRTGRWESHIWDCGKQVYLGGFDTAHAAARAYDRAAIKFRGVEADINFNLSDYEEDMKQVKNLSKEEFVHILRRESTGFSRGSSKYRGLTLHKCGKWEAHLGQFLCNKAYDKAAIKCSGSEAVTNFEPNVYEEKLFPRAVTEASHDIDLNLSISQPSICNTKEPDNPTGLKFQCGSFEGFNINKIKVDYPSSIAIVQPHHVAAAFEHPQAWTTAFPGLLKNTGGSAKRLKGLTGPSGVAAAPQFSHAAAASSGFLTIAAPSPQLPSISTSYHHRQLFPQTSNHNFCNFASR